MGRTPLEVLKGAARWAWERDEVDRTTSRETVIYTLVLYAVALTAIGLATVVLGLLGYRDGAAMLWVFGILFTAFIGAINVGWEAAKYWLARRRSRADAEPEPEQTSDLAVEFDVAEDTLIGFVVTLFALLVLFGAVALAVEMLTWF